MRKISSDLQPMGYATFFQRMHAYFVDLLVFIPITSLANYNILHFKHFGIVVLTTLVWIIYKPVMEWKFGATLGKMVAKVRVVNERMEFPSFNQAMLRFSPYFAISLSTILSYYGLFNLEAFATITTMEELNELAPLIPSDAVAASYVFFMASITFFFFDPKKQCLHDKYSQTYCIKVQPTTSK